MKRQMLLEIIGLSAFWVTEILTANRLLSDTAEEADFLNGLTLAVHGRMPIHPQRRRKVREAQHFTDASNVNPIFTTAGRISVTKCVIAMLPDTTPTQNRFKIILIGAGLHWLIRSACQDIRIL